jgi:fanconi-associated nuclease 1
VQCFKGEALACLCRVLGEDYGQRGSGVPDLFLWNYAEKHCKFVEVKGPGDKLQENQKVRISLRCQFMIFKDVCQLWIDVMLRANANVEVCHVEEQGKSTKKRQTKGKKRSKKTRKKPKLVESDWESESAVSGWEGEEDELNASQYLQGDDTGFTLVRKRSESVEGTLPCTELGDRPMVKRLRKGMHETD